MNHHTIRNRANVKVQSGLLLHVLSYQPDNAMEVLQFLVIPSRKG